MIKLLKAEFSRLFKNKIFIFATALIYVFNIYTSFSDQSGGSIRYNYTPFSTAWVIPFIIAAVTSLSFGGDSMIGNKLATGYSKRQVYFSYLFTAFFMSLIVSSSMLVGGIRLVASAHINVSVLFVYYVFVLFAITAMSSVFMLVTLSVGKKAPALIISFVLWAAMLFSTYKTDSLLRQPETIYQFEVVSSEEYKWDDASGNTLYGYQEKCEPNMVKNPKYIDGAKRTACSFLCYGSPCNIIYNTSGYHLYWAEKEEIDVLEDFQKYYIDNLKINSICVPVSCTFIICSTALGLYLFKKRNVK